LLEECSLPELMKVAEMGWVIELNKCRRAEEKNARREWDYLGLG